MLDRLIKNVAITLVAGGGLALVIGCGGGSDDSGAGATNSSPAGGGSHVHADGTVHEGPSHDAPDDAGGHAHDESDLAPATVGGMTIALAQGHGKVEAGDEEHLVVKLPYTDNGASVVRAWIGTEDRTASYVGKGDYAASHDDYDIHVTAPDPLPPGAMWWFEIEKPDGTKIVGSTKPIM